MLPSSIPASRSLRQLQPGDGDPAPWVSKVSKTDGNQPLLPRPRAQPGCWRWHLNLLSPGSKPTAKRGAGDGRERVAAVPVSCGWSGASGRAPQPPSLADAASSSFI